jgi:hypothetical protein
MWEDGRSLTELNHLLSYDQRMKWNLSVAELDNYEALGARWNVVLLRQWVDGPDQFRRALRVLEEHEKRGIEVVFRVMEDPEIMLSIKQGGATMESSLERYSEWIAKAAETFEGRVKYFLISNEADHAATWKSKQRYIKNNKDKRSNRYSGTRIEKSSATQKYSAATGSKQADRPGAMAQKKITYQYEEYARLYEAAYKAIKEVAPDIAVVDHGVGSSATAKAVAADIMTERGLDSAWNFIDRWAYRRDSGLFSKRSLNRTLNRAASLHRREIAKKTFADPVNTDAVQLHHYGGWQSLQDILNWINTNLKAAGNTSPIIATEVGYRIPKIKTRDGRIALNIDAYSENNHAYEMVKNFSVLTGNCVTKALYWRMRTHKETPVVSLYKPTKVANKFAPHKAGKAFKFLTESLNGRFCVPEDGVSLEGDLKQVHFDGGEKVDLSVAWSGKQSVIVKPINDSCTAEVYDIYGQRVEERTDNYTLGLEPRYFYWTQTTDTSGADCRLQRVNNN